MQHRVGLWAMKDKRDDEDERRVAHWIRYFISLRKETDARGRQQRDAKERERMRFINVEGSLSILSLSLSQLLYSIGRAHSTARRLRAAFPFLIEFRQISPLHHATTVTTTTTTTHNMDVCLLVLLLWSWRDAYSLKRREVALLNKKKEQYCSQYCSERIFSNVAYSLYHTCTIPHCSMNDPKRDEGGGGGWRGEGGEGGVLYDLIVNSKPLDWAHPRRGLSLWFAYAYMCVAQIKCYLLCTSFTFNLVVTKRNLMNRRTDSTWRTHTHRKRREGRGPWAKRGTKLINKGPVDWINCVTTTHHSAQSLWDKVHSVFPELCLVWLVVLPLNSIIIQPAATDDRLMWNWFH